jgi:peptide subunit release factor RF-3
MDRPALNGFEIIEQLEKQFGLASFPVTWPIGSGDRFCGLYHRPSRKVCAWCVCLGIRGTRVVCGVPYETC